MKDLDRAVVVVTGAGSGIGRAAAHAFAARGARVVVTDVLTERAAAVADELDGVMHARLDVTCSEDFEQVRDAVLERHGRVDVVMNNVGVLAVGNVEEIPLEAWQRVIDINLLGLVRSNLAFLPVLQRQGSGHIVVTASTAGLFPYGYDRMPYTATKHAVVGMAEALALYLRPRGIGVTCFCPAGVMTNIVEQITTYGEPRPPRAPAFGVITAAEAGEIIVEAVLADRFLAVTAAEVAADLARLGADVDAYLATAVAD